MSKAETIAISGPSSTGKSSVAKELSFLLSERDKRVVIVQQDNFFKNIKDYPLHPDGSINFEHPDNVIWDELIQCMVTLEKGETAQIPVFEKGPEGGRKGFVCVNGSFDYIIVEGHQMYSQESMLSFLKGRLKIFLKADKDVILARRMSSYGEEDINVINSLLASMDSDIMPLSKNADFVLDTTFCSPRELGFRILTYINESTK